MSKDSVYQHQYQRIGFIGAGTMAQTLMHAFVSKGVVQTASLSVADPDESNSLDSLRQIGVRIEKNLLFIVEESDTLFICVPPRLIKSVLNHIKPAVLSRRPLVVSLSSGVALANLEEMYGRGSRIVSVVPNIGVVTGVGTLPFIRGSGATTVDGDNVQKLLSTCGMAMEVSESSSAAIQALTGSGSAFVFLLIEAMSDGAVKMGIPREMATSLVAQTVAGAANVVAETEQHPAILRDRVCIPGGSTINGISKLEEHGFRYAVMSALEASAESAKEADHLSEMKN